MKATTKRTGPAGPDAKKPGTKPAAAGTGPVKPAAKKPASKKPSSKKAAVKKAVPKKALSKTLTKLAPLLASLVPQAAAPAAVPVAVLDRLHGVILDRRDADPARSHSARLLSRGMAKVAQKFGEEAVECLIEAVAGNTEALVAESADVLYHLLVMWVAAGVEPDLVWAELARREGVSGVAEKAARAGPAGTTKIP